MTFNRSELLAELKQKTRDNLEHANRLNQLPTETLRWRAREDSWNVLECIQHLNWYSDFYLPELEKRIQSAPKKEAPIFKTNWLGKKFVKGVSPMSQGAKGMNTFKDKNPLNMELDRNAIGQFIQDQGKLMELLDAAGQVDLTKVKTNISISKWIKIRLGDTFRVLIYHNERHLQQADRAVEASPFDAVAVTG